MVINEFKTQCYVADMNVKVKQPLCLSTLLKYSYIFFRLHNRKICNIIGKKRSFLSPSEGGPQNYYVWDRVDINVLLSAMITFTGVSTAKQIPQE